MSARDATPWTGDDEAPWTPGEWKTDGRLVYALDETGQVNRFSAHIDGGYIRHRRRPDNEDRTSNEELAANARVIAAGPDAVKALAAIVRTLGATEENDGHKEIWRAAFDVIARARGDTPHD
ncbi:MAG: hypothetical protein ACRYGI_11600 [Janthinobacterium lividum]